MSVLKTRLESKGINIIEDGIAFIRGHSRYVIDPVGIDIKRMTAGFRMGPNQRMANVRGLLNFCIIAHRDQRFAASTQIFMDRVAAINPTPEVRWHGVQDRMAVNESSVSTNARKSQRTKRRSLRRARKIGIIRMPICGADMGVYPTNFILVRNHADLWMAVQVVIAQQLNLRFAKILGEFYKTLG